VASYYFLNQPYTVAALSLKVGTEWSSGLSFTGECLVLQHQTLRDAGLEWLQLFSERFLVKTEMPELQTYHNEGGLSQQLRTVYENYSQFALQLYNLVASDKTCTY
jgi:hypothetical protein